MDKDTKILVKEVSVGIIIFTLIAALMVTAVYRKPSMYAGLALGMVIALAMFISMAVVLDSSMKTGDQNTVQKRSVISTIVRYILLMAILVIVILGFSKWLHPVGVVIGVIGLKVGAYLQPLIHKIMVRGDN
jgi:dipeptide/tripeptide permease